MQDNEEKLTRILDAAADLFAVHPFHKVLLSDIARKAAVGKGTLYLYFKSKDDLYFQVLFRNFEMLVNQLQSFIAEADLPADKLMAGVIDIMVAYLSKRAIDLGLQGSVMAYPTSEEWSLKRMELWQVIEDVIRQGVKEGLFQENNTRLTGRFITGMIRTSCLFCPEGEDRESLSKHASEFVLKGLATS
ncbi:TetR/AcrR family transcriptional regulator [Pseudodesulfovibrio sp. zrk46]|uniref:TetR/AcrR family transcriptional regulator n=1 Tax=Pseudodesulfovibrio sp. zrk46 TaxID=2725288 RepID=UPI001449B191|nr:TetR/AcrR family transcriptional regulator [Pseudodesulfovibrio sp. zrk46]QJB56034.1 TetR/AcrR family transcriptional regulator [Pseudodesulfovibrio sp. zrk46]